MRAGLAIPSLLAVALLDALLAMSCTPSSNGAPPPAQPPVYPNGYPQPYPPQGYPPQQGYPPPQGYPQQPYPQAGYPPPQGYPQQPPQAAPQPVPTTTPQTRALLPPLVGAAAWQAETRGVLAEIIAHLSATNQAKVRGIPMVFDPDPTEVNAFAGCDDNGAPYIAGTEGLLEAADAIAQTQACDELYGTHTYDAYLAAVMPKLVQPNGASAALPLGIIPPQYALDPRRLSRAHEMFDDIVAFTFGHELGHHYLGHTGCANGQGGAGPNPATLGNLIIRVLPGLNQPNEVAADSAGTISSLDTGSDRARHGLYHWSERGAMQLLGFFARLEQQAGLSPLNPIGFLQTHPSSQFRIPIVQGVARTWYLQHPGG